MSFILCIETSGFVCSVAISQNGECKAFKQISDKEYRHAEVLHTLVEDVLSEANLKLAEINAIAVSKGPGSYTGLRVGVSAAKGFCYALDLPLLAISTLKLIAIDGKLKSKNINNFPFTVMIDARRDEVYLQEFDFGLNEISNPQPVILTDYTPKNISAVFCGDGSEKAKKYFEDGNNIFIPEANALAINMCAIADKLFHAKKFEDLAYFEPFYLKEFFIKGKD